MEHPTFNIQRSTFNEDSRLQAQRPRKAAPRGGLWTIGYMIFAEQK
jgi:hypothetical protein